MRPVQEILEDVALLSSPLFEFSHAPQSKETLPISSFSSLEILFEVLIVSPCPITGLHFGVLTLAAQFLAKEKWYF